MKLLNFWKSGIWLLIISYLSFIPGQKLSYMPFLNIPYFDKVVHFGFYFILCLLLIRPYSKLLIRNYLFSFLTATLISGVIEILQDKLTASRQGDFFDFIANVAGAISALIFFHLIISGKKAEQYF
jgi:VanZ family protein